MWFGTDNGLARFDGRRIQNFSLGSADTNHILAMRTLANGELWVGTRAGAFVYTGIGFEPVENTRGMGITAIVSRGHDIWRSDLERDVVLGTESGLVLVVRSDENGGLVSTPLFSPPITSTTGTPVVITGLIQTDHGGILASTSGRGVFFVDVGIAKNESTLLMRSPVVNAIVRDSNFIVWLGIDATRGASGVIAADPDKTPVRISAPTSKVLTLEANDHGTWAGTERYGLFNFVDSKLNKAYTFANTSGGLRSDTIYTLFTDREGVLWIGTNRGVSRFDSQGPFQQTVSDIPNSNFIRTLFQTRDGKIYAGSNRGLFVQNGEKWLPVAGYANKAIYALSEDRSGKLLVDTAVKTDSSRNNTTIVIPGSGTIWQTFEADDGYIWIAGQHGLFRVRDGQSEKIITVEDVRDVFVKDENVWAATTTRGLLHARHDAQLGWVVSAVGFEQGLPSEKAFSILPVKDGLLIATNRGVVTYKPGTIVPKLIATRLLSQRDHNINELRSTVELDYPQNSLLVEVAGQSSRTFPEEFQYAFLLKNSGGEILDSRLSSDPQYAPIDLKPGKYSIESRAFDRDLLSSEPLIILFSIGAPPFPWTAAALGVLLLIAVIALVWAIIERRNIILGNRELAAARFDLANEAERERSRIARDLHDQTLADLRNLMIMSDKLATDKHDFRNEIEAVSVEIRRICEDLSPSVLENVGLVAALEFLLGHTIENSKFSASSDIEQTTGLPVNVELQIYRIVQEVLTNIRSHSDADLVEMTVTIADGRFKLAIQDNGRPFQPAGSKRKGRGIANVKARASLINADVAWNEIDDGNRFSLTIDR